MIPGVREVVEFVDELDCFVVEVVILSISVVQVFNSSEVGWPFDSHIATCWQGRVQCVHVARNIN